MRNFLTANHSKFTRLFIIAGALAMLWAVVAAPGKGTKTGPTGGYSTGRGPLGSGSGSGSGSSLDRDRLLKQHDIVDHKLASPNDPIPSSGGGSPSGSSGGDHYTLMKSIPQDCVVASAIYLPSKGCDYRYILSSNLYGDLHRCRTGTGLCYAHKILGFDKLIVILPDDSDRLDPKFQAELVDGIKEMGKYLRKRSAADITHLVEKAIKDIDGIDQPVGESTEQRLRRLGLSQSIRTLAENVIKRL